MKDRRRVVYVLDAEGVAHGLRSDGLCHREHRSGGAVFMPHPVEIAPKSAPIIGTLREQFEKGPER